MKKLFVFIFVLFSTIVISQIVKVPGTNYPFYSDIIKFQDSDYDGFLEIQPVNKNVKLSATPPQLNHKMVEKNILKSINKFRKQYGRKPLKFSKSISDNLSNAFSNDEPFDRISWMMLGYDSDFNYVRYFENKEEKFCDFLLDLMSVDSDKFFELIDTKAKEVGFVYERYNHGYEFALYIK